MGLTTSREVQPTEEVISIVTPSPTSVISHWNKQPNHHFRQASVRSRASQPIPDQNELDKRFAKVLVSRFCGFLNSLRVPGVYSNEKISSSDHYDY